MIDPVVVEEPAITITVNGEKHQVTGPRLSYADILELAGEKPGRILSMKYYHRKSRASGILSPGRDVEVTEGLVIHAMDTSNA